MKKICQIHTESPVNLQRPKDVRLILLGLPGAGKSSSGNTILGSEQFRTGCDFLSVSREVVSKHAEVRGRRVTVVDTPGFGAEGFTPEQQFEQLRDAMIECAPGPHAFVLVIKIGRISEVDCKLLQLLSEVFDTDLKYVTLLFTHKDRLKGRSLQRLIETTPPLKELLQKCGGRYNVFNNEQRADVRQVQRLLHTVDLMHQENRRHYTLDMLAEKHALALSLSHSGKSSIGQEVMEFFSNVWEAIKQFFIQIFECIQAWLKRKGIVGNMEYKKMKNN
ncbi:hypothetical protein NL108_017632 [Boleophthalmus pectinirostris]|uniref:GTPase IMAP family member 9-like n=1 Tax=Boleophthalmus pectinirostris TaxID=150288 RepID=UPI00242A4589|nr:GTPase IMAP family member 9-like [Boleophthalmus pectinirostris]KAJ0062192.1 hypothetical protein NL108_017632 [Boleophthalmus pectinirostris]